MPTPQVNSIQELFRVQALRQTALTEPSVGILVSSAKSDDDDDNNTVLQASPGAELTVNAESELTGKRRLQQVSTLYNLGLPVLFCIGNHSLNDAMSVRQSTKLL